MAYCINCGTQLPNHAKFCNECGAKQETFKKEQPSEKKITYQPLFHDADEEEAFYEEKSETPESETPESLPAASLSKANAADSESVSSVLDGEEFDEEYDEEIDNDEEVFVPKEIIISKKPDSLKIPDAENSEDFEEDDQLDEDGKNNADISSLLQNLSSYKEKSTTDTDEKKEKAFPLQQETAIDDPYWDDVKPEIDNEIYQIDRSLILKGVGCICALFLVIAYLIYMI